MSKSKVWFTSVEAISAMGEIVAVDTTGRIWYGRIPYPVVNTPPKIEWSLLPQPETLV